MGTSELLKAPKEFLRFYKAGKNAAQQGQHALAHDLLRRAIEIDPYHEQVWLWLASVVETDEDRRVCFENILELNPDNATAKEQLDRLQYQALAMQLKPRQHHTEQARKRRQRVPLQLWLVLLILLAVLAGGVLLVFA